jgi:fused signal recognition particle receptor
MALFWKRRDRAEDETAPVEVPAEAPGEAPPPSEVAGSEKPGFFGRVKSALADRIRRTKEDMIGQVRAAVKAAGKVDENLLERIEEILIKADVGAETTMRIVGEMREFEARGASPDELLGSFRQQLSAIIGRREGRIRIGEERPWVQLVIGVNGVGKTTTIGKLAAEYSARGLKVMLVAGDTFRAAAVEQLEIWAVRTGSAIVKKPMGSDPAGVAFDAIQQAAAEGVDVVIIDTAGRLHTKSNLMEELKKVVRVVGKVRGGAPHETLLVLDATTGQNAISQARVFTEAVPVTGLVMTKLDGTAKGGVLVGVCNLFDPPVVKIGVGEGIDDLRDFSAAEFVEALFEE